jgi:hypothetical protein
MARPAARMDTRLQRVENPDIVAAIEEKVDRVRADEARATCDENPRQKFTRTFAPSKSKSYGISRSPSAVSAFLTDAAVPS